MLLQTVHTIFNIRPKFYKFRRAEHARNCVRALYVDHVIFAWNGNSTLNVAMDIHRHQMIYGTIWKFLASWAPVVTCDTENSKSREFESYKSPLYNQSSLSLCTFIVKFYLIGIIFLRKQMYLIGILLLQIEMQLLINLTRILFLER